MRALVSQQVKKPFALGDRPELSPGAGPIVVELRAAALDRRCFRITRGLYPVSRPGVVLGSDRVGVAEEPGGDLAGPAWSGDRHRPGGRPGR